MGYGGSRGGGSTSANDNVARATASASKAILDKIVRGAGGKVNAGEEVIVDTTDVGVISVKNTGTTTLTLPATLTKANIATAGFKELAAADGAVSSPAEAGDLKTALSSGDASAIKDKVVTAETLVSVSQDLGLPAPKTVATVAAFGTAEAVGQLGFLTATDGTNPPGIYEATTTTTWTLRLRQDEASTAPVTSIRDIGTAVDTRPPSEKAVRTLFNSMASATQSLANGGTPAAGGVYVQAIGSTHVVPALVVGQRCTVIQQQAGGGTVETTYLHDGNSQITSVVRSPVTVPAMQGATSSAAGVAGLVPAPSAGSQEKFFRGDGTWAGVSVTGRYIGSAATFAALPTTSVGTGAAVNGDWAALTATDIGTGTAEAPQYKRGVYVYTGSAYSFAIDLDASVPKLTKAQAEDGESTAQGTVSGQLIKQAFYKAAQSVRKFYKNGETIDFDTINQPVADGPPMYEYAWGSGVTMNNAPQAGATLGVTGHGYYTGDATDGQQFVYFWRDSRGQTTEYLRTRSGGTWGQWTIASSDDWVESGNGFRYVDGSHVILGDGHAINILAQTGGRPLRFVPRTSWANVGEITAAQNDWTFSSEFPGSGAEEVVVLPIVSEKKFVVSRVTVNAQAVDAAGVYLGAASTYDSLPVTVQTGNWAVLTADVVGTGTTSAPQYPRGLYRWNGTAYELSMSVSIPRQPMAVVAVANGGIDVALGPFLFRLPSSGNRSMAIATASGTATTQIQNLYNGTGSGSGLISKSVTTTPSLINSSWNFTTAGTWQEVIVKHTETGEVYRMRMEIGASYNNNTFAGSRL